MESDNISLTAIIGIIGAMLTVLIKLFDAVSSWKKSRDTAIKEKKEVDQTKEEVEFINTWLAAVAHAVTGEELELRKQLALGRLDKLMEVKQNSLGVEKTMPVAKGKPKSNVGFYAMSAFLSAAILGLFIDDEDNWSLSYFEQNLDSDTLVGFVFFLIFWVYFLVNSRFFSKDS